MTLVFIIFIACSILFISLGIIVYKLKKIEILSYYDGTKKYDRDTLAKIAGKHLIDMGIWTLIINVIFMFLCRIHFAFIFLFMISYCFVLVWYSVKVTKDIEKLELKNNN
ncbi:hypothetical protein [Clostridium sp. C8-1-8]|uniref:hypothetical protein n=1 Tax=Clostridium sp. C8-1-8 TaxID=2698831 RepID=UPI0013707800|nr:hypothetical protein [Clostridium sp. C8-1-8]